MPSENPNEDELIRRLIRDELREYMAPFPGRIVTIDLTRQVVDVSPFRSGMPMLRRVPLLVPGTAASGETIKVAPNDFVLCIPCMFSLDEFLGTDTKGPVDPADPRQQDVNDVFAIPLRRNPAPTTAEASADRSINGADIKLGTAASAKSLVQWDPAFQSTWDAFWTIVDAALVAASATPGTYLPGTVQAAVPTFPQTTHLKGS